MTKKQLIKACVVVFLIWFALKVFTAKHEPDRWEKQGVYDPKMKEFLDGVEKSHRR